MRAISIDVRRTGEKIKAVAGEKGYRPTQFQEALGLESVQAVYLWFEGKRVPSTDNLLLLARLFQVSMDYLLVGVDDYEKGSEDQRQKTGEERRDE